MEAVGVSIKENPDWEEKCGNGRVETYEKSRLEKKKNKKYEQVEVIIILGTIKGLFFDVGSTLVDESIVYEKKNEKCSKNC